MITVEERCGQVTTQDVPRFSCVRTVMIITIPRVRAVAEPFIIRIPIIWMKMIVCNFAMIVTKIENHLTSKVTNISLNFLR